MPPANCLPLTRPTQPNRPDDQADPSHDRSIRREEQPSGPTPAATKQANGPQTADDPHTATAAPGVVSYDVFASGFSPTHTPDAAPYPWADRQPDGEPGLCSYRLRHYNGTLGRWLADDPVGFDADDANRYPYASDLPTEAPTTAG